MQDLEEDVSREKKAAVPKHGVEKVDTRDSNDVIL